MGTLTQHEVLLHDAAIRNVGVAMSIERARADLIRLNNAIADLRTRLADAELRAEKVRIFLEMASVYGAESVGDPLSAPSAHDIPRSGRPQGGVSTVAVDAATAFIREARAPQHTRVLLSVLEKNGIHIGGNNPVGNLSGFLSRASHLKNSRSNGWSLREWPTDWPAPVVKEPETHGAEVVISKNSAIEETDPVT